MLRLVENVDYMKNLLGTKTIIGFLGPLFISACSSVPVSHSNLDSIYIQTQQECQDLACVRAHIDKINSDLLKLLTVRTAFVRRAGDLKSQTTQLADDQQRVLAQEKNIKAQSVLLGLPVEISVPAFRALVEASTAYEQKYINNLISKPD